jgi:hypothetical protein
MLHRLEREFAHRGTLRGAILLLEAHAAKDFVKRCREEGVRILGVDSFTLDRAADTIQPSNEHSVDYSARIEEPGFDSWAESLKFLADKEGLGFVFEVTLE